MKLLRVLQERKVRGVGAAAEIPIDVRVLAATNRDVEDDVRAGQFRQDLYYRLNVIRIEVPPLRDRREDIRALAEHFLAPLRAPSTTRTSAASRRTRCARSRRTPSRATCASSRTSSSARWRSRAGRRSASATCRARSRAPRRSRRPPLVALPDEGCNLDDVLGEVERRLLLQALERSGGVRTQAAKLLGVTLRSLRYRLQKHALGDPGDDAPDSESSLEAR